ncbi:MAG: hypothetical protein LBL99_03680 [Holosporaceae bacterium]|nr:hypothetical protein [Holosporaceae bacterium]
MLKVVKALAACSILLIYNIAVAEEVSDSSSKEEKASSSDKKKKESGYEDSFLNIKFAHERENEYAFGPNNGSAVALMPFLAIDEWHMDGSFYYGRQRGYLNTPTKDFYWGKTIPYGEKEEFFENGFKKFKKNKGSNGLDSLQNNALHKPHFHRSYTRAVYASRSHNFRVMIGDVKTSSAIGFQPYMTGGGVSFSSKDGNGSTISGASSLLLDRPTRLQYRVNGVFLANQTRASGLYAIDDLAEELMLPGASVTLRDQMDRTENIKIDYFSNYNILAKGKNSYDVSVLYNHKWDKIDPFRLKYRNKPRFSSNYKYGYSDDVTIGFGAQAYEKAFTLDGQVVFAGDFGKISPNVAYSDSRGRNGGKSRKTGGFGAFYAIPENDAGIYLETLLAYKGRDYADLGLMEDEREDLDDFIKEYLDGETCFNIVKQSRIRPINNNEASTRKVAVRLYSKPIYGITPAFVFKGEWASSSDKLRDGKLREYTLCFTTNVTKNCIAIFIAGLSYKDPDGGRNRRSPDRRINLTFTWNITPEFLLEGTYLTYDGQQRRPYGHARYKPEAVKGLEAEAELYAMRGSQDKIFTIRYETDFFDVKAVEEQHFTYDDKKYGQSKNHLNAQQFYFGTSLSKDGFGQHKKNSFNVIR